jgi:nucleoid-associated protein YgaU
MFARIGVVLLTGALLWAIFARDTGAGGRPEHYRVRPGDTLWSIAEARYVGDPREGVWKLEHANGLESAAIVPGQVLAVP